jgi:hypothetical protein
MSGASSAACRDENAWLRLGQAPVALPTARPVGRCVEHGDHRGMDVWCCGRVVWWMAKPAFRRGPVRGPIFTLK